MHTSLEHTYFVWIFVKPLSISPFTLIALNGSQSFKAICPLPNSKQHWMVEDATPLLTAKISPHTNLWVCHTHPLEIEEWSIKRMPMTFLTDYVSHIATPLVANNEACQNENWKKVNHHHEQQSSQHHHLDHTTFVGSCISFLSFSQFFTQSLLVTAKGRLQYPQQRNYKLCVWPFFCSVKMVNIYLLVTVVSTNSIFKLCKLSSIKVEIEWRADCLTFLSRWILFYLSVYYLGLMGH